MSLVRPLFILSDNLICRLRLKKGYFWSSLFFYKGDKYTVRAQERFKEFPHTKVTVRDLIKKFRRTGSVKDEGRSGRPTKMDKDKLDEMNDKMMQSPSKLLRKL